MCLILFPNDHTVFTDHNAFCWPIWCVRIITMYAHKYLWLQVHQVKLSNDHNLDLSSLALHPAEHWFYPQTIRNRVCTFRTQTNPWTNKLALFSRDPVYMVQSNIFMHKFQLVFRWLRKENLRSTYRLRGDVKMHFPQMNFGSTHTDKAKWFTSKNDKTRSAICCSN